MARKLRLEFPGACYHVINRGNYRRNVFADAKTKAAFAHCLFEACEKSGWVLHAFVVMRNHFHLAIETPQGNLVTGMQWLQATFAVRFNRLRDERGHLFQGRYKALLVEEGEPLAMVCHYIHLNPVRAGIVPVERLGDYADSSYAHLRRPTSRPGFLSFSAALAGAGDLPDDARGWSSYADYLAWQAAEGPAGTSAAYVNLSRGWVIGGAEFKRDLLRDHAVCAETRAWEKVGVKEVRELRWKAALAKALLVADKSLADVRSAPRAALWKLAIATWMKQRTQVSNRWLALHLHLGAMAAVSRNVTRYRRIHQGTDRLWERLMSIIQT
jgi:REP element-mobilizing transposase RayT